jgi:hypothetical protein
VGQREGGRGEREGGRDGGVRCEREGREVDLTVFK